MGKAVIWSIALLLGAFIGTLNQAWLNGLCTFVATVYTRLFQYLSVPTIALALTTTLASLGQRQGMAAIFRRTIILTFLTTLCAAIVGLLLYLSIAPDNLPQKIIRQMETSVIRPSEHSSYVGYVLDSIPGNIIQPFLSGNMMSVLLVSVCVGLAIARLLCKKESATSVKTLYQCLLGLQELFYMLISALVWTLPLAIMAFAAQLSAQMSAGFIIGSLGKYVAVILAGNFIQSFVVLPLFLMVGGVNPFRVFRAMIPAVLMALFTKSSAATLPITIRSAEDNMKVPSQVSRFVLPICTTINMNGCATFILVTSLYVMQNGGMQFSLPVLGLWVLISVLSAVGNAGVPMGCYFLTLSLMSSIDGAPIGIMGVILPVFTIIDMVETAENVWSDSCVCAMVAKYEVHD